MVQFLIPYISGNRFLVSAFPPQRLPHSSLPSFSGIDEKMFCELFEGLRSNDTLVRLSASNCDVNDFAVSTLSLAVEHNTTLKSLNLESNRIG